MVKKELFGQLKLPQSFTDGDQAEVVASIHNDAIDKGPIDVTLKTTIGGKSVEEKKTITVDGKGIREVAFPVDLKGERGEGRGEREAIAFELTVAAGGQRRRVAADRAACALRRAGLCRGVGRGHDRYDRLGRTAEEHGDRTADAFDPRRADDRPKPAGRAVRRAAAVPVRGGPNRLGHRDRHERPDGRASGCRNCSGVSRDAAGPQAEGLDARIRSAVSLLVSSQNSDGGWGWTGAGGASERYATSRALWALSLARKAGYNVPDDQFQKAVGLAQKQIAAVADNDYESKAILLHALSTAGQGDFALANRLHRERLQLSTGGAGLSGAGLGRNGSQADGRRIARRAGQAKSRQRCVAPHGGRRVRCPGANRRPSCTRFGRWRSSRSRRSRRRRRRSSIGSWPIASAIAGRPTRRPGPPRWRCAAGRPKPASTASATR